MVEDRFPLSERLLMNMHNIGVIYPDTGRTLQELAQISKIQVEDLAEVVGKLESEGYIRSFVDSSGLRRYHLTDLGILRVSSAFT